MGAHDETIDLPSSVAGRRATKTLERALFEVKKVVVGQDRMTERLFVCLLARGHVLLEGAPGLAKTLAAETLARTVGGDFARLQFTPDLVPADLVGTRIYKASTEAFEIELGPVFANVVLADEINRAPAKVQSALLEVMAERHVSIGGTTFAVPDPFIVMATQNPIEHEGVYPLPEAQRDRFLMKVVIDYPSAREEVEIVRRMSVAPPVAQRVLSTEELLALQQAADAVFIHDAIVDYAVRLVLATRAPQSVAAHAAAVGGTPPIPPGHGLADLAGLISHGASPRATLGLVAASRALALLRGREFVLPQDVYDVAPDVLRHRVLLSYDAIADGVTAEQIVNRIVSTVLAPRLAPSQDNSVVGSGFGVEERAS
jgi:MoxR-like ATPase